MSALQLLSLPLGALQTPPALATKGGQLTIPLARTAAALSPWALSSTTSADVWEELNRPPIEFTPDFTVTPVGWAIVALYIGWFSWSIFRPPSEAETLAYERQAAEAAEQAAAAGEFLQTAANEEGATKTLSGLVYKEITPGTGNAPTMDDTVVVHYTGKLANGSVFDSSYKREKPAEFKLKQVIRGWGEGLQLMKVGGKGLLTIPADLAYGPAGIPPTIPGNAALQFEVELLEIKASTGFELPF